MNLIFPVDLKQGISALGGWGVFFFKFLCVWILSQKNTENETFLFLPTEKVSSFLGRGAGVALELLTPLLCEGQDRKRTAQAHSPLYAGKG